MAPFGAVGFSCFLKLYSIIHLNQNATREGSQFMSTNPKQQAVFRLKWGVPVGGAVMIDHTSSCESLQLPLSTKVDPTVDDPPLYK